MSFFQHPMVLISRDPWRNESAHCQRLRGETFPIRARAAAQHMAMGGAFPTSAGFCRFRLELGLKASGAPLDSWKRWDKNLLADVYALIYSISRVLFFIVFSLYYEQFHYSIHSRHKYSDSLSIAESPINHEFLTILNVQ